MKRALSLLALLLLFAVPWASAQVPAVRVILVDPTGTHAASISGGNLGTTASVGDVTVESIATVGHITSAIHVAGIAQTVLVNCVTGCAGSAPHTAVTQAGQWTIAHIASVVHVVVGGRPGVAAHQAGTWTVDASGSTVTVSGTIAATQSGAWNISAAQSGLWSIASAHIVGGSGHLAVTFAGGGHVAVTQAAAWSVAATQSGAWAVSVPAHVAVSFAGGGHVAITQAGTLSVSCSNCTGGSSDAVNVFHQSTIRHISSVTHVYVVDLPRSAHLAASQSGSWTIQAAHQGGAWVMNVQHIAAMLHVAIVDLPRWAHMAVAQSGIWNVTAHQGGTGYTIQHISSVVHVAGMSSAGGSVKTENHLSGALRAWRVASCGTTTTQAVASNANRRTLIVNNIGTRPVYLGYGATGHVALTQANGYPMHSMGFTGANGINSENHRYAGPLILESYQGPISCIAPALTDLSIIEILR
jgi:hypothetical protein